MCFKESAFGSHLFLSLPVLFCILSASVHLFILRIIIFTLCVQMFLFVHMYEHCKHVCYPPRPEEGTLDPLQMVVSHPVGAGKWTQDLHMNRKCSNHWTISPTLSSHLFLSCNWGQRRMTVTPPVSKEKLLPPCPFWNVLLLLMKELRIWVILMGLWVT